MTVVGDLTIYQAATMLGQLTGQLEGAGDLILDLSAVTELDCAGVQVLLVVEREAAVRGRRLRLLNPSAAVEDALETLNLRELGRP
jgi:anti-sigma B factor antagonist